MTAVLDRPASPPDARPDPPRTAGRWRRVVQGSDGDPRWVRPSAFALLFSTAVLYLWGLGASGNANTFYAAAVQAGTKSWKAFFFGSFDSSNFITVDKPPASLWVMELSGRLFGFNSWSMLAPQALEGVASVGLLYLTVRRISGPKMGLLAGAALAITPVATLMFRFNNPDALLTLLLVGAGYAVTRAIESASTRWLALTGALVGFGFLTKMGQALLVVPAFGLAYLIAAPTSLRRRIVDLIAAVGALIVSAGWWVAIVELWPASSRPYIGGSTNNSVLELAFGYNGLGRLFGGSGNGGGGGGGTSSGGGGGTANASFGGATGLGRLFRSEMGTQISWLLPTALVALVLGFWLTRRAPRTDRTRAALIVWGGWLILTGLTFSYMEGTIHPYYTVVLASAIAAIVAMVGRLLWRERQTAFGRLSLAGLVALTAAWDIHLLGASTWHPELRYVIGVAGALAIVALLAGAGIRKLAVVTLAAAAIAGFGASAAYALDTAATTHQGSTPTAGPSGSSGGMGGGGSAPSGTRPSGGPGGSSSSSSTSSSSATSTVASGGSGGGGSETANSALTALLKKTTTKWAAATSGSQTAGPLELASGKAVMSIGGFNGSDAAPSLAQFEKYVAAGQIKYYIVSGTGGGASGSSSVTSQITTWVAAHFTSTTVGGSTVYDLTSSK